MKPARSVRLGKPFMHVGRYATITYSRARRRCSCGMPFHEITPGDLSIHFASTHTRQREYWHIEHLEQWKWELILVDLDGNEIARFGC